jgi:hypothetical protein
VLLPGLPVLAADTIRVTAEGLADPNAEAYQRDQGIMLDDLRQDARRQVIEKAVGSFIDSNTLVENYVLLEDRVFSKSTGLIKRVIKESDPWLGEDGFMHLLLQAEVYVTGVEAALQEMSRSSRVGYIRQYGDPKISVAIFAQDVERGSWESRSEIAENILKEHISAFGYRVWSEEMSKKTQGGDDGVIYHGRPGRGHHFRFPSQGSGFLHLRQGEIRRAHPDAQGLGGQRQKARHHLMDREVRRQSHGGGNLLQQPDPSPPQLGHGG